MTKAYIYSAFGEAKYPYLSNADTEFNQDGIYKETEKEFQEYYF